VSSQPTFSVVIPTYNRAELLQRAIRSALNQTFEDFELLIVDDCSTDQTGKVVESFLDERLRYIRHDMNKGAPATRNTGISQARSEYVAFLDDDDEYLPNYLAEMSRAFEGASSEVGFGWCGGRWLTYTSAGPIVTREGTWQPPPFQDREEAYLSFVRSRHIGTNCGLAFRKSCFSTVGLFDERLTGGAEDTEFFIRIVRHYDFIVVPDILIVIHLHPGSHLRTYSAKKAHDYEHIIDKNMEALLEHPDLWSTLHYKTGWLHYHAGDKTQARKFMGQALRKKPLSAKIWLVILLFEIFGSSAPKLHQRISTWKRKGGSSASTIPS